MHTLHEAFLQSARSAPENPFICTLAEGGRRDISYRAATERVRAVRETYARAGFGHGHRVALLLGQTPTFIYHFFALNGLGCTIVPVNPDYRHDELHYLFDHSESDMVVAQSGRVDELRALATSLQRVFHVVDVRDFVRALKPAPRPEPKATAPSLESVASILYTSGTTGRPKGCVLTNECHLIAGAWYRDLGGLLKIHVGQDRLYNPSPFHHVNNLVVALTCMVLTENCLILTDRFSASRWWPEVVTSGATIVHYLGVVPSMLMSLPPSPDERSHTVRFGFGAGIEPQLHEPCEERFGFPFVEIWGMTEIPRVFAANIEPRKIDRRAFGRAAGDNDGKIVDENDQELPDGTAGEFVVRTRGSKPHLGFFSGYLKDERATEDAWRNGWFHTGDIALRSADGMFCFVDRKKNIIWRGGESISAVEVEEAILSHPAVAQVACIAVPDERCTEEVMACVVAKPDVLQNQQTAEEIFAWCNQRLAYHKTPGWLIFRNSLPLTPSQRLQRTRIFPPNTDPRAQSGAMDLRPLKRRS